MPKTIKSRQIHWLFLLIVILGTSSSFALDSKKYITIDQIDPSMDAYCLTVMQGTTIEKFDLKILSIVKNAIPGRDRILVVGTDPKFIHAGPIRGCSGSPVYIDGKMAGALSSGWSFSKDPLYMVTPIEDMLEISNTPASRLDKAKQPAPVLALDFTKPLDLNEVRTLLDTTPANLASENTLLTVTSLPEHVCQTLKPSFEKIGLVPVAGAATSSQSMDDIQLAPGSTLVIPLVTGDISMAVTGTVTEVDGNKVYGFGHPFLGYGQIDLPMATGKIHTVVSTVSFSFKLASAGKIVGAIRSDLGSGIYGEIGQNAPMIPIRIDVDRFDDPQKHTFNCELAVNRFYTPQMSMATIMGAAAIYGNLPPEHTVKYNANIETRQFGSIVFENISSGQGLSDLAGDAAGIISLLMNNPYQKVDVTRLDFNIEITPDNLMTKISNVILSDSNVEPGQTVDVKVILQPYMKPKTQHTFKLTIPRDLADGEYEISVFGSYGYDKFLRKNATQKYLQYDVPTLITAIKNIVKVRRDRLYITLELPDDGIIVKEKELPFIPATKALLLGDPARTLATKPHQHWIEKSKNIESIVTTTKTIKITVEK
ncbi:MAG TPA: hypothetical protein ENH94_05710 [Phycisphaerales bacterium]|nr:hypothetical protein [Phycisphaerales bacterium]